MDMEKVIDGLKHCVPETIKDAMLDCSTCPYQNACKTGGGISLPIRMIEDIRTLLKEQEDVSAHWDDDTGHWIEGDRNGIDQHTRTTGEMIDTFRCSWCGFYQYWKTPFCPNCGAKMEGR